MTDSPVRPTPERLRQGGIAIAIEERGADPKPWFARESIFDHYLAEDILTDRQHKAAATFNTIYYRAFGSGCQAQTWETRITGGEDSFSDSCVAARGALDVIARKMTTRLYGVLRAVCGLRVPASRWAKDAGLHPTV